MSNNSFNGLDVLLWRTKLMPVAYSQDIWMGNPDPFGALKDRYGKYGLAEISADIHERPWQMHSRYLSVASAWAQTA